MSIKAIVYDIEINILKVHYDPVILKIKKERKLSSIKIKNLFFSPQFYFFTIGKINFETFIKTIFNEFIFDSNFINKLENKYKKSIEYRKEIKENILKICSEFDLFLYFSADIDYLIYTSIIKKDPQLTSSSFFSFKINSIKQENPFLEYIKSTLSLETNQILIVDDNINVLLKAKNFGYLTLFYDGERDFKTLLKLVLKNNLTN